MSSVNYPTCLCRDCGLTFVDSGPYATYPGPTICPVCCDQARDTRLRSRGRGRR